MHLHHDSIGADGDAGSSQRDHLLATSGPMTGIHNDREMAQTLHGRHNREIQRVAGMLRKRAHAALAEDDIVVAFGHDVFGGQKQLLQRRRHPALQEDGDASLPGTPQQAEVLHIPRADLHDIRISFDQIRALVIYGFGHDLQAEARADFGQNLQPFFSQPLERIRRRARLIRPPRKNFTPSRLTHSAAIIVCS